MKSLFLTAFFVVLFLTLDQKAGAADDCETDPLVLKKLEWFQDIKFGLLMHWGPYSQWGVVESWSICPEDEGWCARTGTFGAKYWEYKSAYEGLQKTFNPSHFSPTRWARAAKSAGMRYVVFTTKHHDGFCMFDSKYTTYKITDTACPFSANPRKNIAKEIFDAFRNEGMGIGAYFSKPDWHSPDYWWPYFPPKDRNVNYAITKYPDRWKRFSEFTADQIEELMTAYGRVDILWLDGGWVNPANKDQNIDIPSIAAKARSHQPGLIVVDRAVPGRYENYRTPEQQVPDQPPDYVWETCMTMATSWSYVPGDTYKPAGTLIRLLVDIVAKGGNFLLNIGPGPDGEFAPEAYDRLRDIGAWMNVNATAIYDTRPVAPYSEGDIRFTQSKSGRINAIVLTTEGTTLPERIHVDAFAPAQGSSVIMLGTDTSLRWKLREHGFDVEIPTSLRDHPPCEHAVTIEFTPLKRNN
jgi:alpha-L-fucosidase